MIDHAWGRESFLMEDIKNYRSKSHSVSFLQILPRDYEYEEAAVVMAEMAIHGCLELYKRHVITNKVWIGVGLSITIDIVIAVSAVNRRVVGSSPTWGATKKHATACFFHTCFYSLAKHNRFVGVTTPFTTPYFHDICILFTNKIYFWPHDAS